MSESLENTIFKQVYTVDINDQSRSSEIQSTISLLQQAQIQRILDKVLSDFSSDDKLYQFREIELNLGNVAYDTLEQELPLRIEQELRGFLSRHIINEELVSEGKSIPIGLHLCDVFKHYLYYGYFKWQAGVNETPSGILAKLLNQYPERLVDMLKELGRYNHVIKRLVYQFNDDELEQLVEVITPDSAKYIIAYKDNLLKVQEQTEAKRREADRTNLRNKIWEVIFAFLLNKDEVTFNNRQHFLKALITQVAVRNNELYINLLFTIRNAIKKDQYDYDREGFLKLVETLYAEEFSGVEQGAEEEGETEMNVDMEEELRIFLKYGHFSNELLFSKKNTFSRYFSQYIEEKITSGIIDSGIRDLWSKIFVETTFFNLLPENLVEKALEQIESKEQKTIKLLLKELERSRGGLTRKHKEITNLLLNSPQELLFVFLVKGTGSVQEKLSSFFKHVLEKSEFTFTEFSQFLLEIKDKKIIQKDRRFHQVIEALVPKQIDSIYPHEEDLVKFVGEWSEVWMGRGVEDAKKFFLKRVQQWSGQVKINLHELMQRLTRHVKETWYDLSFSEFVQMIHVTSEGEISFEAFTERLKAGRSPELSHSELNSSNEVQQLELDQTIQFLVRQVRGTLNKLIRQRGGYAEVARILQRIADQYDISSNSIWHWIREDKYQLFDPSFQVLWEAFGKSGNFRLLVAQQSNKEESKKRLKHFRFVLAQGKLPWWSSAYTWGRFEEDVLQIVRGQSIPSMVKAQLKKVPKVNWLKVTQSHLWKVETFYLYVRFFKKVTQTNVEEKLLNVLQKLEEEVFAFFEMSGVLSQEIRKKIRSIVLGDLIKGQVYGTKILDKILSLLTDEISSKEKREQVFYRVLSVFTVLGETVWVEQLNKTFAAVSEKEHQLKFNKDFYSSLSPVDVFLERFVRDEPIRKSDLLPIKIAEFYKVDPEGVRDYFKNKEFVDQLLREGDKRSVSTSLEIMLTGEQLTFYKETDRVLREIQKHVSKKEFTTIWRFWHEMLFFYLSSGGIKELTISRWKTVFHNVIKRVKGTSGLIRLVNALKQENAEQQDETVRLGIGWELLIIDEDELLTKSVALEKGRVEINEGKEDEDKPYRKLGEEDKKELTEAVFANHCGLVIIAPYLGSLFERCDIGMAQLKEDNAAKEDAVRLLMYAATGKLHFEESEAVFAKVLSGLPISMPIDCHKRVSEKHQDVVNGLLRAVTSNWKELAGTSIDGLRATFLQRSGRLQEEDDAFYVHVEEGPYDMLLDRIPWGIRTLKLSWLPKIIDVTWRN